MSTKKHWFLVLMITLILACAHTSAAFAAEDINAADTPTEEAAGQNSPTVTAGTTTRKTAKAAAAEDSQVEEAAVSASKVVEVGKAAETTKAAEETAEADTAEGASDSASGLRSLGVFKTTGYCPCYQCSEGWGRHTCTGAIARSSHTIAVDPRVIPYGSQVMINGVVYTAEDRGGAVRGNHIDIFYDTHAQTRQHGKRNAEVFLVL